MATIFTENYSGDYGNKYELKAEATESNVSTSNNTSKVTVNIYLRRIDSSSNGAYNNDGTAWSITIDGSKTSGNSSWDTRNTTAWQKLGSASKTVTHNSNGSKTITISATHTGNSASGASKMGNASGSGTFKLTNIPRYASISSFTVSNVSGNNGLTRLKFSFKADSTIDYVYYSTNNGSSWKGYNIADGTSGNFEVSGLSPGTSYKCKLRVRRKDSQLTTDSSTVTKSTYDIARFSSYSNFNLGNNLTVKYTNPARCNYSGWNI